jgi:hypothetical protein
MGLDVTAIVFGGFGAIAHLVKTYKNAAAENRPLSLDEVNQSDEIAQDLESAYYGKLENVSIDLKTLEVLWTNIDAAQNLLRDSLGDANKSETQKQQAIEAASATVCVELSRIRRLNRGVLPHPDLQKIAASFGCVPNDESLP